MSGEQCCPGETACKGSDLICSDDQCLQCGGKDQPCCPGDVCITPRSAFGKLYCETDQGVCKACGFTGYECCPGEDPCGTEGYSFCNQGVCSDCGFSGQPCCTGDQCSEMSVCNSDKTCESCLYTGQSCTADWQCCEYHTCTQNQTCGSCGGVDEAICSRDGCRGWLVEVNEVCTSPFESKPETDLSICTSADSDDNLGPDLCFWHAAYFKNDNSLCSRISFTKARSKCEEGGNPKYYLILSWPKFEWTNP